MSRDARFVPGVMFDWMGTLYDPEAEELYPGVIEVLEHLKVAYYRRGIVSIVRIDIKKECLDQIERTGASSYVSDVLVTRERDKFFVCNELLNLWGIDPQYLYVVDDRCAPRRSLHWGSIVGANLVWMRRGRYKDEMPIGYEVTHVITDIRELPAVLNLPPIAICRRRNSLN
ncbi:hypothetical protein HYW32_02915 [Candidatus Berkelbacteria bacterium]|nr:hypothetical protein [Candidatus Berkelbacteria bacterium]